MWWGLKGLRFSTHKYLPIIWSLVTTTSLYGRRCSSNHLGMSMSGMSTLSVLSLLDMSRVCSMPCFDTNQNLKGEVRIWICRALIIIFVLEDRLSGGGDGAESRRYDHARLEILWCSRCINWLLMGCRNRIFITCLLFTSQAWSRTSTERMGGEESKLFLAVAFASQALQIITQ